MRRRTLLVVLVGVAVLVALTAAVALTWRVGHISPAGYARIRQGMSRNEVSTAIGLPSGEYHDLCMVPIMHPCAAFGPSRGREVCKKLVSGSSCWRHP